MLLKSLATAALAAAVVAQPVQHQHHQHEKRVVVTQTVYLNGDSGLSTASPTIATIGESTQSDASQYTASSTYSDAVSSSTSSSSSFSAGFLGITYSPYADDGSCKSASEVKANLALLSDYSVIRIYGVDCEQVANVLAALGTDQKLLAGIYDLDNLSDGISTLASAVKSNGGWDKIYGVSIGNEMVNSGDATASQMQTYLSTGKSLLKSAGYTGDVFIIDTFVAVKNNPELCNNQDYIICNAHPFFDGYVAAADSGAWVKEQIEQVSEACGGKTVIIGETGWPKEGESNNKAVPGVSEQKAALESIQSAVGEKVFAFTAFDDKWKSPGEFDCEQSWGIYTSS